MSGPNPATAIFQIKINGSKASLNSLKKIILGRIKYSLGVILEDCSIKLYGLRKRRKFTDQFSPKPFLSKLRRKFAKNVSFV